MSDQPSYYSIITANVRYDNELTDSEKLLFSEITALSNKNGYCSSTNNYFSNLYDVAKETISRRISKLNQRGYIKLEIIKKGKAVKQRRIYPLTQTSIPIEDSVNNPIDNSVNTPIDANVKENNTSINITSNNNINRIYKESSTSTHPPYKSIIDFLNKKTGKHFRCTTQKTQSLIKARMREGFTEEQFKQVIDIKTNEWKGIEKFEKYLRPETLFGTKFESYLNQQSTNKESDSNPYANLF
ncbi:conserved phage C-terminal domain-containing protein [Staphylococcus arlettae]|uniref:conserved phage C-terminal domain-containing protein n=1 Tax=Staphylococcus arlettae TaxID=29378 RepID=UPI001E511542|nr:conserved phage C-terminal domain-containing protein [Staphylococcus arlettae]